MITHSMHVTCTCTLLLHLPSKKAGITPVILPSSVPVKDFYMQRIKNNSYM